jgi:glycosyltransferase involved in cell wall biosynthesis
MLNNKGKINILFLNDYLHGVGGAERNLIQLLQGIDNKKFNSVICCFSCGEVANQLKDNGYQIFDLDVKRVYGFSGLKAIFRLTRIISKQKINLIVTYHEGSDIIGMIVSILTRVPVISSRRDLGYKLKKTHIIFYKIFSRYYSKIISVSNSVKNRIEQRENVPSDKIVTIANGVDFRLFNNNKGDREIIKKNLGVEGNYKIVGIIAGLRTIKGHKIFIEAATKVIVKRNDVVFLIVGKDEFESGNSRKDLLKYATDLGVDKHLIFTGERNDVPDILSIMDIVVNASFSEGMSNTLLEAMAAKKIIIASNVGGNPEIIQNGVTGYLFPSGDSTILAQLIVECLDNLNMAKEIGGNARFVIEKQYDVSVMCRKNMDLYQEIVNLHSRY